jgi:hypothetical protein
MRHDRKTLLSNAKRIPRFNPYCRTCRANFPAERTLFQIVINFSNEEKLNYYRGRARIGDPPKTQLIFKLTPSRCANESGPNWGFAT